MTAKLYWSYTTATLCDIGTKWKYFTAREKFTLKLETCTHYESGTQTPKVCRVLVTKEREIGAQRIMKTGKVRENKWEWLQHACPMQLPSQLLMWHRPAKSSQSFFSLTATFWRASGHHTWPHRLNVSFPPLFFSSFLPVYFLITIPSKGCTGCATAAVV